LALASPAACQFISLVLVGFCCYGTGVLALDIIASLAASFSFTAVFLSRQVNKSLVQTSVGAGAVPWILLRETRRPMATARPVPAAAAAAAAAAAPVAVPRQPR